MADEEDDFMSDKFLQLAAKADSAREPQNLLQTKRKLQEGSESGRDAKRQRLEAEQRAAAQTGTLSERMEKARKEGLAASIPETNIGHKLLARMGYVAGGGIGKNKQGRAEPVPVTVKTDKLGVGSEAKERRLAIRADRKVQTRDELSTQFKSHQKLRFETKRLLWDFAKCQGVCEHLGKSRNCVLSRFAVPAEQTKRSESNTIRFGRRSLPMNRTRIQTSQMLLAQLAADPLRKLLARLVRLRHPRARNRRLLTTPKRRCTRSTRTKTMMIRTLVARVDQRAGSCKARAQIRARTLQARRRLRLLHRQLRVRRLNPTRQAQSRPRKNCLICSRTCAPSISTAFSALSR